MHIFVFLMRYIKFFVTFFTVGRLDQALTVFGLALFVMQYIKFFVTFFTVGRLDQALTMFGLALCL